MQKHQVVNLFVCCFCLLFQINRFGRLLWLVFNNDTASLLRKSDCGKTTFRDAIFRKMKRTSTVTISANICKRPRQTTLLLTCRQGENEGG